MSYVQSAVDGDLTNMLRFAILNSALWAIGTAWSTGIRAVMTEVIPKQDLGVVGGEVVAALTTTAFAVAVSYAATRRCCERRIRDTVQPSETDPPRTMRNRV